MRYLLSIASIWLAITGYVIAFGERGANERMLYYAAYLAEEIMGDGFTVGVGCTGSRAGGRCNFLELMLHIWAPGVNENNEAGFDKRPQIDPNSKKGLQDVKDLKQFLRLASDSNWGALVQQIMSWNQKWPEPYWQDKQVPVNPKDPDGPKKTIREPKGKFVLTGFNDPEKTVKGCGTDWYKVLKEAAKPIGKLKGYMADPDWVKNKLDTKKFPVDSVNDLVNKGGKASYRVAELRRLELDHGAGGKDQGDTRLKWMERRIRQLLGVSADAADKIIQTMDDPNKSGLGKLKPILDVHGTVAKWSTGTSPKYPDIAAKLGQAHADFEGQDDDFTKEHLAAMKSAQHAIQGCGCTPVP